MIQYLYVLQNAHHINESTFQFFLSSFFPLCIRIFVCFYHSTFVPQCYLRIHIFDIDVSKTILLPRRDSLAIKQNSLLISDLSLSIKQELASLVTFDGSLLISLKFIHLFLLVLTCMSERLLIVFKIIFIYCLKTTILYLDVIW